MAIAMFGKYIGLWIDLIAVLSIITFYVLFLSKWIRKIVLAFKLPGPKAWPFIGNCLLVTNNEEITNLGRECCEKYGSLFRLWIFFLPTFVILEPKDLQKVLGNYKNTEKAFFYSLIHNLIGDGLVANSGTTWKTHRKLLQPSFNINILETFIETFWESSNLVVHRIKNAVLINTNINITTFINNSVLDILNEAVLGITIKDNSLKEFYDNSPFRQGKVTAQDRVKKPWLLLEFLYMLTNNGKDEKNQKLNLNSFAKRIIKNRQIERSKGISKSYRTNLLEKLLDIQEANPSFTDEDIVNEICTFMLAGQESVATVVAVCLYFLANNKNIQNNVVKEIKTIFLDSKRMPNTMDLNKMKYLELCIKETLRLCPSVPVIARKIGEDIKVGKHILPAGSNVFISPYVTHRLPYIYPNPEVFDPERFRLENVEKRHPYSFIPFSGGPRNCIGYKFAMMEMKTIVSTVLRNFELSVVPKYDLKLVFRVTIRAKGGIWLTVKPRL